MQEIIAQVEVTRATTCTFSLDFQVAFGSISHQYLFKILQSLFHGTRKSMYANADSSVQINGHVAGPISTRCSIRYGCPMSMVLFALCTNSLPNLLDKCLTGISLGRSGQRTAVLAHAEHVTIFVAKPDVFTLIRDAIRLWESVWNVLKYQEVQSPSNWRMRENGERPRCRVSPAHKDPRNHLQQHDRQENARKLGVEYRAQAAHAYGWNLSLA